jgi:hypothetical protein
MMIVYSFNFSGSTSRINVAHFMARLITDDDLWTRWQGQMRETDADR